jgi:hypothetical protein
MNVFRFKFQIMRFGLGYCQVREWACVTGKKEPNYFLFGDNPRTWFRSLITRPFSSTNSDKEFVERPYPFT